MDLLFFKLVILSPLPVIRLLSVALGIFLVWQVLTQFFEKRVVLTTSFLILFATNFFWLALFSTVPAHALLFTLFLIMVRLVIMWQKEMKWLPMVVMLPVMLLISFSAPGMFIILIPVFVLVWNTGYRGGDQSGASMGFRDGSATPSMTNWLQLLFLAGIFILCIILRQFPWFTWPGEIFYSGNTLTDRFPIEPANIHRVLFSVKNGWIVYTPLVIPAIAGFYFLSEKNRALYFSIFLFLLISLIYTASLPHWWYNDSFGYPNLIETYAVLSIPLGFFVQWLWQGRLIRKIFLFGIGGMLIMLNIFQTWQFEKSIIIPELMTENYYCAIFGKTNVTAGDKNLMKFRKPPSTDSIPDGADLQCNRIMGFDFEQPWFDWSRFKSDRFAYTGKYSLRLNPKFRFSPGLFIPIRQLTSGDSTWIRVTASFYYTCKRSANEVFLVITSLNNGNSYKYRTTELISDRFSPNRWNKLKMKYLLPVPMNENGSIHVYFWNYGDEDCYIDDFEINLCKPTQRP